MLSVASPMILSAANYVPRLQDTNTSEQSAVASVPGPIMVLMTKTNLPANSLGTASQTGLDLSSDNAEAQQSGFILKPPEARFVPMLVPPVDVAETVFVHIRFNPATTPKTAQA